MIAAGNGRSDLKAESAVRTQPRVPQWAREALSLDSTACQRTHVQRSAQCGSTTTDNMRSRHLRPELSMSTVCSAHNAVTPAANMRASLTRTYKFNHTPAGARILSFISTANMPVHGALVRERNAGMCTSLVQTPIAAVRRVGEGCANGGECLGHARAVGGWGQPECVRA